MSRQLFPPDTFAACGSDSTPAAGLDVTEWLASGFNQVGAERGSPVSEMPSW